MGRVKANWKLKSFSMAVGSFARLKAVEPFAKGKNIGLPTHKSVLFLTYCIIVSVDDFSCNLSKS